MRCASSAVAQRPALARLCSPSDLAGRPLKLSTNSGTSFEQTPLFWIAAMWEQQANLLSSEF